METNINRLITIAVIPILTVTLGCSTKPKAFNVTRKQPVQTTFQIEDSFPRENSTLPEEPTLDDCILYALRESRDVRAAYSLYQAALEKAPQVSSLPEPRLSYGYFINAIETRTGPMRHKVGVAQPIPWFGKLSLREEVATAEAKAAFYSFLNQKNQLVSEVVKAFYELA